MQADISKFMYEEDMSKVIIEKGQLVKRECFEGYMWSVSTVKIYDKLIKLAGRHCKNFSSDIIYDIEKIDKELFRGKDFGSVKVYLFGFRENGVDSTSYVLDRFRNGSYGLYKSIYKLTVQCNYAEGEIVLVFGKAYYDFKN